METKNKTESLAWVFSGRLFLSRISFANLHMKMEKAEEILIDRSDLDEKPYWWQQGQYE